MAVRSREPTHYLPETHVSDGSLVGGVPSRSKLGASLGGLELGLFRRPNHTTKYIGHASGAVGTQDLDSYNMGRFRNAIATRGDGAGAVST